MLREWRQINGLTEKHLPLNNEMPGVSWYLQKFLPAKVNHVELRTTLVFFEIRATLACGQISVLRSRSLVAVLTISKASSKGSGYGRRTEAPSLRKAPGHCWAEELQGPVRAESGVKENRVRGEQNWGS